MDWVKHLFGVILLGVAAFYLVPGDRAGEGPVRRPGRASRSAGFTSGSRADGADRAASAASSGRSASSASSRPRGAFRTGPPAGRVDAYSDAALAQQRRPAAPVVLDFSATGGVPCHELDNNTVTDPRRRPRLSPFTRLQGRLHARRRAADDRAAEPATGSRACRRSSSSRPDGRKCARRASSDSSPETVPSSA